MGNNELKRFLIRAGVVTAAFILVMYLAKVWFVDPGSSCWIQVRQDRSPQGKPEKYETPVISWKDAARHCGEWMTVEGKIVAAYNSGKACFLNFHPDYKRHFTAVIFASAFTRFPPHPEEFYRGKKVRVTGYIKEYQGKPEIILSDPEQIEILD